jgi:hypothetical protein
VIGYRARSGFHGLYPNRSVVAISQFDALAVLDFILSGADAFVDNLTPGTVLAACLEENARRLGGFDRRLLAAGGAAVGAEPGQRAEGAASLAGRFFRRRRN